MHKISFNVFSLQDQSFRIPGKPEFPNYALQPFSFHGSYLKHIICEAK